MSIYILMRIEKKNNMLVALIYCLWSVGKKIN